MSRFSSMFSQLLKLFPRTEFQALVKRTYAERHARGFSCWGQFSYLGSFAFSSASCSLMNARISSATSSSFIHCSL